MNGFEFLQALDKEPIVILPTAYSEYALQAGLRMNSVDFLLKPIEPRHLKRALNKLERIRRGCLPARANASSSSSDRASLMSTPKTSSPSPPRLSRNYCIDQTIAELEQKLDPRKFVRIHRSTVVNVDYVHELYNWFGGRMLLRLKDDKKTELQVARDRVKALKDRLSL